MCGSLIACIFYLFKNNMSVTVERKYITKNEDNNYH